MRPASCVDRCPACPHRDFSQHESESQKQEWIKKELVPWQEVIQPILSPEKRWGYRRKNLLHARHQNSQWQFGLIRRRGREEEFVPIPECPLHFPGLNEIYKLVGELAPPELPLVFVLVSGKACTLVIKSTKQEKWFHEIKLWEKNWPKGYSLFVNWNPVAGRRALDSRRTELVLGSFWQEEGGWIHGPVVFRQQIPELEDAALTEAEYFFRQSNCTAVVDLFCGLGVSLRRWEDRGWRAVGVELQGESIEAAKQNAPQAHLLRGRVEDRLPQVEEFLERQPFILYTNPPRSGHGEKVLEWILQQEPKRIAYLSCHPRSLAGDLKTLNAKYEILKIQPLDFFPQTNHVENLSLLRLRGSL